MSNQKENKSPFLKTIIISLFATLACVGIIKAATTIGTNITTTGTLTTSNTNTLYGATAIGGALTATSTLAVSGLTTLGNASTTQLSVSGNSYLTNTDIYQGNLDLDNTTNANQYGVITKNGTRFIHDFNYGNNGTVTTLGYNTFVGKWAGNLTMGSTATSAYHSSFNTAIGYSSLSSNTIGYHNTAVGYNSLDNNTIGYYNTAVGYQSLSSNTEGYYNTAIGYDSLLSNTTGYHNTAIGYASLRNNTTGYHNTANGFESLRSNEGYQNTAIGYDSLQYNITGNQNIAIGYYAGRHIANGSTANTTGDYNIFIGGNTKAYVDNDQNEIVIGYDATGLGSNSVVLGNSSITTTALRGNVGIGTTTPSVALDVNGIIKTQERSTATCNALNAGGIYFDSDDKEFYGCNGTAWEQLSP